MKKKIVACLFSAALIAGTLTGCGGSNSADIVVTGNIYTENEDAATVQAVAIKDGTYTYVGDKDGVEEMIGDDTKVIETGDGMAMPSFTEAHAHGADGGMQGMYEILLYDAMDYDKYMKVVKDFVKENPDMEFYKGGGWDNGYCPAGGPKATDLDKVCKDKPIVLYSGDHHSYWANTKAMEMAGIDKNTKDVAGGVIVKDADGNPTGTFRENAMGLLDKVIPEYTVEQCKEGILAYQNEAKGYGVTSYYEPMVNSAENLLQAYNELDEADELVIRCYGGYQITADVDTDKELEKLEGLQKEAEGGMFELNTIKLFMDGVVEGGTAYLLDGYPDDPSYKGEILWDQDELNKFCAKADKMGFQLHSHAIGDGAVQMAVNAYEYVQEENGDRDRRDAITHVQLVEEEDFQRMADLGVIAASNPYWYCKAPGYYEEVEVAYMGENAKREYPMKSFFDAGVVVTTASDYPVTIPPRPLDAVQYAVTRYIPELGKDTLLGPDQRVTVEQMMKSISYNGAYQNFAEDTFGSIAEGMSADMVVLDKDITKIDPAKISTTNVTNTILEGEVIFGE